MLIHRIKNRSWDNFYDNGSHPNRFISNLINPLSPARCEWNLSSVIFERMWVIDGWSISGDIALRWMSPDLTDDKSTLVQVMAWCRQATSHYMSQCWPISVSLYAVTRPQRVNIKRIQHRQDIYIYRSYSFIYTVSHSPVNLSKSSQTKSITLVPRLSRSGSLCLPWDEAGNLIFCPKPTLWPTYHDGFITWKRLPHCWHFVKRTHRSHIGPVIDSINVLAIARVDRLLTNSPVTDELICHDARVTDVA